MSEKPTSISDNSEYRNCCATIAGDDVEFSKFKQNPFYTKILEHASKEQAQQCISIILDGKLDLSKLSVLRTNDDQGSPTLENYNNELFDGISPSTIRYIKVLSDMIDIYTHLNGFNIVEIGVGYGGQCKVLNDYFDIKSYDLVDLPEVLDLVRRYLYPYNYNTNDWQEVNDKTYDLVISNYAITECDRDIQQYYIDNIIKKSKHGYITCNYISDRFNINSMSQQEFIDAIGVDVHVIQERPLTFPGNIVLIW